MNVMALGGVGMAATGVPVATTTRSGSSRWSAASSATASSSTAITRPISGF
ncbi:MAG: hypothetical protein U0521_29915 [Anaerolineae bacterium]